MRKALLLVLLYVGLAVLPLALAEAQSLPRRPWRDELSSALAIMAFAMLLLEFALSGRYRPLSAQIGMDVTMRFHQLSGLVVVAFLLVHPVLYSLP